MQINASSSYYDGVYIVDSKICFSAYKFLVVDWVYVHLDNNRIVGLLLPQSWCTGV